MPWTAEDAPSKTKRATTAKLRRTWADIANDELEQHGSESAAIKTANAAIKRASYQHEMTGKGKKRG